MILSLLLGFLLGAAALLFALQNTGVTALTFLGWQFESSLALLILIAFASGALTALLVSLPSALRDGFRIMRLKRENKTLVDEITRLRTDGVVVEEEPAPVLDIRNRV
ncbi:MAG TPA: LapA family protein [Candidatus Paceibacterota bacterium]|nr:LapA family protein [Candidatus Paceibacterota bacterium]